MLPGPNASGRADSSASRLQLFILDRTVRIDISGSDARQCLGRIFSAMIVEPDDREPDMHIGIRPEGAGFRISPAGARSSRAGSLDDLVYQVEKIVTIGLQLQRPELLFLHSAAVVRHGKAILLAADTGSGKSTTTWGLLQHGFGYLTDELSAVCPEELRVYPYPHALCLKRPPPKPYTLPSTIINLGRTLHVPAESLDVASRHEAVEIGAAFLVRHDPSAEGPRLRSLSPGEATARLYVTCLNVLAHPDAGLGVVLKITERTPCFDLRTADLSRTCELVRTTFDRVNPC